MHVRRLAIAALTVLLALPSIAADLTGNWVLTVDSPMGKRNPTLVLQQKGNDLTGTYTGRFGTAPLTGKVTGDNFTFTFTAKAMMQSMTITYEGKANGNNISGKVHAGDVGNGEFTGVKK